MHDRIDLSQICTSFANAACAATYWCYVGTPAISGELRGVMTKKRRPPRIKKARESSVGSLATNPHEGSLATRGDDCGDSLNHATPASLGRRLNLPPPESRGALTIARTFH